MYSTVLEAARRTSGIVKAVLLDGRDPKHAVFKNNRPVLHVRLNKEAYLDGQARTALYSMLSVERHTRVFRVFVPLLKRTKCVWKKNELTKGMVVIPDTPYVVWYRLVFRDGKWRSKSVAPGVYRVDCECRLAWKSRFEVSEVEPAVWKSEHLRWSVVYYSLASGKIVEDLPALGNCPSDTGEENKEKPLPLTAELLESKPVCRKLKAGGPGAKTGGPKRKSKQTEESQRKPPDDIYVYGSNLSTGDITADEEKIIAMVQTELASTGSSPEEVYKKRPITERPPRSSDRVPVSSLLRKCETSGLMTALVRWHTDTDTAVFTRSVKNPMTLEQGPIQIRRRRGQSVAQEPYTGAGDCAGAMLEEEELHEMVLQRLILLLVPYRFLETFSSEQRTHVYKQDQHHQKEQQPRSVFTTLKWIRDTVQELKSVTDLIHMSEKTPDAGYTLRFSEGVSDQGLQQLYREIVSMDPALFSSDAYPGAYFSSEIYRGSPRTVIEIPVHRMQYRMQYGCVSPPLRGEAVYWTWMENEPLAQTVVQPSNYPSEIQQLPPEVSGRIVYMAVLEVAMVCVVDSDPKKTAMALRSALPIALHSVYSRFGISWLPEQRWVDAVYWLVMRLASLSRTQVDTAFHEAMIRNAQNGRLRGNKNTKRRRRKRKRAPSSSASVSSLIPRDKSDGDSSDEVSPPSNSSGHRRFAMSRSYTAKIRRVGADKDFGAKGLATGKGIAMRAMKKKKKRNGKGDSAMGERAAIGEGPEDVIFSPVNGRRMSGKGVAISPRRRRFVDPGKYLQDAMTGEVSSSESESEPESESSSDTDAEMVMLQNMRKEASSVFPSSGKAGVNQETMEYLAWVRSPLAPAIPLGPFTYRRCGVDLPGSLAGPQGGARVMCEMVGVLKERPSQSIETIEMLQQSMWKTGMQPQHPNVNDQGLCVYHKTPPTDPSKPTVALSVFHDVFSTTSIPSSVESDLVRCSEDELPASLQEWLRPCYLFFFHCSDPVLFHRTVEYMRKFARFIKIKSND